MTELSYFWDGIVTGDATRAPYTSHEFLDYYRNLLNASSDKMGVIAGQGSNLAVSGAGQTVTVAAGMALVDGTPYDSSASVDVAVPIPASATRVDTIVLQKISAINQTVRVARVAGAEGGSAPTLTQVSGGQFEYPLVDVSITTGGVMTLTDRRIPANGRIVQPQKLRNKIWGFYDPLNTTGPGVLTTRIPGGLLGSSGAIIIEAEVDDNTALFAIKATYGGTSIGDFTGLTFNKAIYMLKGNGATNAQRYVGVILAASAPGVRVATGTLAVDSTLGQDLVVTLTNGVVPAEGLITIRYYPPTL